MLRRFLLKRNRFIAAAAASSFVVVVGIVVGLFFLWHPRFLRGQVELSSIEEPDVPIQEEERKRGPKKMYPF